MSKDTDTAQANGLTTSEHEGTTINALGEIEVVLPEHQVDELLHEFDVAYENAKISIVNTATKYKLCVDAGIDMVKLRGISSNLGKRLLLIAEGKLTNEFSETEILGLPMYALHTLSKLSIPLQNQVLKNG